MLNFYYKPIKIENKPKEDTMRKRCCIFTKFGYLFRISVIPNHYMKIVINETKIYRYNPNLCKKINYTIVLLISNLFNL